MKAMKQMVAIDNDGVISDSNKESYFLVKKAWHLITDSEYPFRPVEFRLKVRPFITTAGDFFSFTQALIDGLDLSDPETIRHEYHDIDREGISAYHRARDALRNDEETWMGLMPVYDGVKAMFEELGSYPLDVIIVSSKDEKTIRKILDHNSLSGYVDRIIDANMGRRRQQLSGIIDSGYEPDRIIMYDDASENLRIAQSLGCLAVAAPQGYDLPIRMTNFIQAYPAEFPGVVKDLLNL